MIVTRKQQKYLHYHEVKLKQMNVLEVKNRMIEEAKFPYSSLGKALEKQTKTIEGQGRKQIDGIINQNVKQVGLLNNNGKSFYHKDKFEKLFKKHFVE